MNNKFAICFYGFLRNHKSTIENWKKNVLEPLDADIFVCCPDTFYALSTQDNYRSNQTIDDVNEKFFYDTYGSKIKGLHIIKNDPEKFKKIVSDYDLPENNMVNGAQPNQYAWRIFSMFNHIKSVLELCKKYQENNNIYYDNLILARPDLIIKNKYDLNNLNSNIVYSSGSHTAPVLGTDKWISDHLLISKQENIMKVGEIYDKIQNFYKDGVIINQETLIGYNFMKYNIEFERNTFSDHEII